MPKVAGITILYHPGKETETNILSYINQLDKLFIVDNSEEKNKKVAFNFYSYQNITLIENNENIGIAAALNKSAEAAVKEKYDFLLTMDQDSRISENLVASMVKEFEKDNNIGILSPFVVHTDNPQKPSSGELQEVTVAMTSGCMIRLSAFQKVSGFLEKFFIDYVDNEFCLRMHLSGYKVLQFNSVFVYHKFGTPSPRKFFFRTVYPTNHIPIRWYYRTRNRFFVYKKYKPLFPDYVKFDKIVFLKDFIKILLYEADKIEKIKMIILGYIHYKKNKFGKFE